MDPATISTNDKSACFEGSVNNSKMDSNATNSKYMKVLLKPLTVGGNINAFLGWIGLPTPINLMEQKIVMIYGILCVVISAAISQLFFSDLGYIFHAICGLIIPVFSIACAFYWIALYLRQSWNSTSIYALFCSCFFGEFIGQYLFCDQNMKACITRPILTIFVLKVVSVTSLFSSLEAHQSTIVILSVSVSRYMACTSLAIVLPQCLRPYIAYIAGIVGVIGVKYVETLMKHPLPNGVSSEGKIPVIRRRRSSASGNAGTFTSHRVSCRRTSLPAFIHSRQQVSDSGTRKPLIITTASPGIIHIANECFLCSSIELNITQIFLCNSM